MNLQAERAAAVKAAKTIIESAQSEARDLTEDEVGQVEAKHAEIEGLDRRIKAQGAVDAVLSLGDAGTDTDEGEAGAKSLGEHFVKSVGADGLRRVKSTTNTTVAAPEWKPDGVKAPEDPHVTTGFDEAYLTTFDRTVVQAYRRPTVTSLLGTGTLGSGSNAVTYLVESGVEGNFGWVAENGQKPSLHFGDPTTRTDALKKVAGILTFSDEMVEDLDFWVSEINNRGLYLLSLAEEAALLSGPGGGANIEGIRNRSGVQTEASGGTADNADALFRAMTKVQTATGLNSDAIVINPVDYQRLRLQRDGNGQYFGGGFFEGQYGNGTLAWQPPIWGQRTVVSTALAEGEALVGAFSTAATVYQKGGVRVESTNSHESDFAFNRVRTRIEKRLALAVRVPSAFVNVTLATA